MASIFDIRPLLRAAAGAAALASTVMLSDQGARADAAVPGQRQEPSAPAQAAPVDGGRAPGDVVADVRGRCATRLRRALEELRATDALFAAAYLDVVGGSVRMGLSQRDGTSFYAGVEATARFPEMKLTEWYTWGGFDRGQPDVDQFRKSPGRIGWMEARVPLLEKTRQKERLERFQASLRPAIDECLVPPARTTAPAVKPAPSDELLEPTLGD